MAITDLWIIRHGETDWNIERRLQGWADIELNARGLQQAEVLSHYLADDFFAVKPIHAYSSDLQRAYVTAEAVCNRLSIDLSLRQDLRERNYGILEGKNWSSLKNYAELRKANTAIELSPIEHQAESLEMLHNRVQSGLHELTRLHPDQSILLFSHGGTIDMIWRIAKGLPKNAPREITQKNTAINHLHIHSDGSMRILDWANTEHVHEAL